MNKKETYNTPDRNDARQRKIKRSYLTVATVAAAVIVMALPVYADDPLATINALSNFVFSAIKAIDWCHSAGLRHCADRSCPQKPRCRAARAGLYDLFRRSCYLLCQGYSGYDSVRRSTMLIVLDYFLGKSYIILSKIPALSISIMSRKMVIHFANFLCAACHCSHSVIQ